MTTLRKAIDAVNRAERVFQDCRGTLSAIKAVSRSGIADRILNFQMSLASAVFALDERCRVICRESDELVQRKKSLNEGWFNSRMRRLAQYQDMLVEAGGVGRALGDCFATFMYRKNPELLNRHLRIAWQRHTPPGVGGRGEQEFLRIGQGMHGHLVLYHGITNILRIGDRSFVDCKTFEVAAVGEPWS